MATIVLFCFFFFGLRNVVMSSKFGNHLQEETILS